MGASKLFSNESPSINGNILRGRAVCFYDGTTETEFDLGDFIERIDRNCEISFDPRTMATYGHRVDNLLGTIKAGTLKINIDERGVNYEIDIPPTSTGNEVKTLIARGDLDGSSFQFFSNRPHCEYTLTRENGRLVKTITKMTILELGPVAQQSYMGTSAELRSLTDEIEGIEKMKELEKRTKERILADITKKRLCRKR